MHMRSVCSRIGVRTEDMVLRKLVLRLACCVPSEIVHWTASPEVFPLNAILMDGTGPGNAVRFVHSRVAALRGLSSP